MINGTGLNLGLILGRIDANSSEALCRLDRVDLSLERLNHGQIDLARQVGQIKRSRKGIPATERWIKRILTWGLPIAAFIATGSWEIAAKVMRSVAGL